jgi:fibronectin type 3 domain-containing protein
MRKTKHPIIFYALAALVSLPLLLIHFPVLGAAQQTLELFLPVSRSVTEDLPSLNGVGRSAYMALSPQAVSVLDAFTAASSPLNLKVATFSGSDLQFTMDDSVSHPASVVFTGTSSDGQAQLTLALSEGVLFGSINAAGSLIRFYPFSDSLYIVHETPLDLMPEDEPPLIAELTQDASRSSLSLPDNGSQIDVMVIYTPEAQSAVGGAAAMQAMIGAAIAETNTGYQNSGILQRLNLVHASQVNYSEANFNWSQTLVRLKEPNDGYMDEVHTWRDVYAADVVMMMVSDVSACGIAWLMGTPSVSFESYAFGAVSTLCATGYYSFGHELGHMMGGHHDRQTSSDDGAYAYSHAYQAPDNAFRTVLAYNCPGGCPRVNHYANPLVYYGGQPTGVDYRAGNSADNARTFNNTAWYVANFRNGPPPAAPSNLSAAQINQNEVTLSWQDNSQDEQLFTVGRRLSGTDTWETIATPDDNSTSYNDTTVTAGLRYDYQVIAWNGNGASDAASLYDIIVPLFAPADVTIQDFSQSHIRLIWSDLNASEAGTRIFRRPDDGSPWTYINTVNADITQFVDNSLSCGRFYDYWLEAFNASGVSPAGIFLDAQTALCDPEGFSATAFSSYDVALSWNDNNQTETAIEIERRLSDGGQWFLVAVLPANQQDFTDSTVMCETAYQYRMRSFNGVQYSAYSTPPKEVVMGTCTELPEIPMGLNASSTYQSIQLSWEDGRYETGYELQRTTLDSKDWVTIASLPMNATTYFDENLRSDHPFQYRLRAINSLGQSSYSMVLVVDVMPYGAFIPVLMTSD